MGSGLVIAPNLTLTLSQVPVVGGGSAAGTLQTGQRVGSAIGIAAVGSVFFAQLPSAGWRTAFDSGLIVSAAFVLGALVLAMTDVADLPAEHETYPGPVRPRPVRLEGRPR